MHRTKFVSDDAVVCVMTFVDPQGNGSVLSSDSVLQRDDSAFEFRLTRGVLQALEVERFRLERIDFVIPLSDSSQNRSRVADVRANIQHVSTADERGKECTKSCRSSSI